VARSSRLLYRAVNGRIPANYNWDAIHANSAVVITAAEWKAAGGIVPPTVGRPYLGAANVSVTNVGPHDPEGGTGGVEFILNVDWPSPLDVIVTITVFDDVEGFDVV
jgi:hypothetical protein